MKKLKTIGIVLATILVLIVLMNGCAEDSSEPMICNPTHGICYKP